MTEDVIIEIKNLLVEKTPRLTPEQKSMMYKIINPDISNYVKYGVKVAEIENIVKNVYNKFICNYQDAIEIFKKLTKSNVEEEKFAAFLFLNRFKKNFNEGTIDIFREEYAKHCHTWSHCDSTCAILIDVFVLIIGFVISCGIPYTGNQIYSSLKRISYLPNSNFEICTDGIKVRTHSGDAWIPFEDDLIIYPYDCMVKMFTFFDKRINDGIQFNKFNKKEIKFQVGPVENHEFFYLLTLYHYLNWLNENNLILNEEHVKEHYFLSDPFKKTIAEKIMLNEEITEAIDVPTILDMHSFTIESEKAIFKYSKDLYKYYISDDEKIYYIHQQVAIPPTIRRKFSFQIFFICILGLTSLLLFLGFQNEPPGISYVFIYPLLLYFLIGDSFFKTIILLKNIKNIEVTFTDSKIIFKRKDWIYPLSYDDTTIVKKTFENSKKQYYEFLYFHSKKKLI